MGYKTEQEKFWAGDFGKEYIERNKSNRLLAANVNFFVKALNSAGKINSVIEFGSNVGMNLKALKILFPEIIEFAVEINSSAVEELKKYLSADNIFNGSIFDYKPDKQFNLSMSKGVLIHINPSMLGNAYEKLYQSSNKFILIAEYFNPSPVSIDYRGNKEKLFKRDFCAEMMTQYPDLELVDYGFCYKKDPAFSQDDITWFLLRKTK